MRFASVFICLLFFSLAQSGSKLSVGTTQSILSDLVTRNVKASSTYTFLSSSADQIPVIVEDFYLENGKLSMVGKAQESENSDFILKGDINEVYGWVLLKDKNLAYEYTTDGNKNVTVEQVPISKVLCVDEFSEPETGYNALFPDFLYDREPPSPHIGEYNGENLNELQSLPGAEKVLWCDIRDIMSGTEPLSQTKEDVWRTWQSVASGYSMYDVNVTTDQDIYQQAGVTNSGIAKFYNQTGRSYSPVNAFGTTRSSTVYRQSNGYGTGRTGLHETGHLMGVYDYGGNPGGTYFVGFAEFKWVPIMGNYWYGNSWGEEALYQWSKGEYNTATCKQDFLDVANKNLPYREDDIPNTVPLKFSGASQILAEDNWGQIEKNTDSDGFTFEIIENSGQVNLRIDRIEYIGGAMLDVDASILDESGSVVIQDNPKAARYAELETNLSKGKYTLLIKGGAEGTPQTGFSTYSSLGYYAIEGEITGGSTEKITTKMILSNSVRIIPVFAGAQVKIVLPKECKIDKITVYAVDGRKVFHSKERIEYIDFSDFAAGVYTVSVGIDGMNVNRKIIKK